MANLVKGIKVPVSKKEQENKNDRSVSLKIFKSLTQPNRLEALRSFSIKLADVYEANPSNYGLFYMYN